MTKRQITLDPEITDAQWQADFMAQAVMRKERLDILERNRKIDPTLIDKWDFLAENKEQLEEAYTYFCGLPPDQRVRCARQFRDCLVKLHSLRDNPIWREFFERTLNAEEDVLYV